ncbi:MAG: polysaccharide deacetylase family protein [Candidatus Kerfeldbacteria bacterium]
MSNYRQFSPYRHQYRPHNRFYRFLVWAGVCVVVILLIKNVFSGGSGGGNNNTNGAEITLAGNTNGSVATSSIPQLSGTELSTQDCPKAIYSATVEGHYVALTVDSPSVADATSDTRVQATLASLKAVNVPVSLFAVGAWAEAKTDLVKQYHDAGIEVFNHSNSHTSFKGLAAEKIDSELEKADTSISAVTGVTTKPYFRPPFGDYDTASLAEARSQGYCTIIWTVDAQDWKSGMTVDTSKARVVSALKDGAIIVVQAYSDIGADLISPLVDVVKAQGYTFVSLRDLLRETDASNLSSGSVESTNPSANVNSSTNTNASTKKTNTNATKDTNTSTNTNKKTNTNTNTSRTNTNTNTNTSNANTNS